MPRSPIQIIGQKALMDRLDRLESQGQRNRIARPAVSEAATKINKKAKALAPVKSSLLKKSIGVKRATKNGVPIAIIGPRHGFKQEVERDGQTVMSDPTKYAHLVEFGTKHSQPKPFLRPAYDATPSEAIIRQRMAQELKKQARKK